VEPDGLALLSASPPRSSRRFRIVAPDWLPAFINAVRAFLTIGAVTIFWIVTQWLSGTLAIVFATAAVSLLAPRAEQAYSSTLNFIVGVSIAAVGALVVLLAVLPNTEGFVEFVLGEVSSVARGITAPKCTAQPAGSCYGKYPIFTWVRLAQGVPIRIRVTRIPDAIRLVAGMTATVEIDPQH
jgi:Fusaric acid resistance protein family